MELITPSKRTVRIITIALLAVLATSLFLMTTTSTPSSSRESNLKLPESYHGNVTKETRENTDFRRVVFTGANSQLVVMSIPPGGEVGKETHKYTEQTLFFLSGTGEGEFNGEKFEVAAGDVAVVVPGTEHNFRNTGTEPLKLYTVYAPPNHIDGRVHVTKADADADTADEAIGEAKPACAP